MPAISCPHQVSAARMCPGCSADHPFDPELGPIGHCDGTIEGRVFRDSDGDVGVIYGVRHFLAVEDEEADCGCQLTEQEWEQARDKLAQEYAEDDSYADMLEDEGRREARF
jgi:hypothetical protein